MAMSRLSQRGLFSVVCSLVLGGCALFPPNVEPFYFESASFVFPVKEARFTPMDSSQEKRYSGEFLEVRVQSKTNLAKLAEEREYNLWVEARFCDETEPLFLWGPSELRYQDAEMNYNSVPLRERTYVQALIAKLPKDAPKSYHFHIGASGYLQAEYGTYHGADVAYDLKNAPRDICVKIRGGGYIARGFESSVIVVPKEKIQSARLK